MAKVTNEQGTAYHEAGHAVLALELGMKVKRITIEPDGSSLGQVHTKMNWGKANPELDLTPHVVAKIERQIICSLAGPCAEAKLKGRRWRLGAAGDHHTVVDIASYIHFQVDVLEKYLAYMYARTEFEVSKRRTWLSIGAVAKQLLKQRTMTGRDAVKAISDAWDKDLERYLRKQKGTP